MKVLEFRNIQRKESPLSYRKEFHADAVMEFLAKQTQKRVAFVIEHRPVGPADIQVKFMDELEFPLIPVMITLKQFIRNLEEEGGLP